MYSEFFNKRLKKFIAFDGIRLHKIGRLTQNCFLYLIFTFVIGLLLNDIFPKFDNEKTNNKIILEIIGQMLVLAILIFYLRKIVLLFPYAFTKFADMSFDQPDISSQYAEQAMILMVIISTQRHLLKKIHYLYETYNANKVDEEDDKNKGTSSTTTTGTTSDTTSGTTSGTCASGKCGTTVNTTPQIPPTLPTQQPTQPNATGDYFNNMRYNVGSANAMDSSSNSLQFSAYDSLPPMIQSEPSFSGNHNHNYDSPNSSPPQFNNNPMNNYYSNPSTVSPMPSNFGGSDSFSTNITDLKDFNNTGTVRMPDYNNLMGGAYM